jgi:uncharacterized protein YceK
MKIFVRKIAPLLLLFMFIIAFSGCGQVSDLADDISQGADSAVNRNIPTGTADDSGQTLEDYFAGNIFYF